MAYNCNPCDCPEQHYRDSDAFKKAMITLLCNLIANTGTLSPTEEAIFDPLVRKNAAAAEIPAAFAPLKDLSDGTRSVTFDNQTDGEVMISMDGGLSTHYNVQPGQSLHLNLFEIGKVSTAVIHFMQGTVVPLTGMFYVYSMR